MAFVDVLSDDLTAHGVDILRFDAATRRKILGQLQEMQEQIIGKLATVDFASQRARQLEGLLEQTEKIIKGGYRASSKQLLGELEDLAGMEQRWVVNNMNSAFKVDILSGALTPQALRSITKQTNILGAPATEWWGRQAARTRNAFAAEMRQGFLLGESTGDLIRRVRGTATGARRIVEVGGKAKSVHVFSGGIMEASTREAEALVRTSVQSITNEVRFQTYRSNQDVVKSIQAAVTLDSKTSTICQTHGALPDEWDIETLEPIGGSNPYAGPPPWHFNCRSTLVPITKSWEELQQEALGTNATRKQRRLVRRMDKALPAKTKAAMDGARPQKMNFNQWLKKQPKSVQLEMLGPAKHSLWKQGQLSLSQMLNQTGRPLTVAQIEARTSFQLPSATRASLAKTRRIVPPDAITLPATQTIQEAVKNAVLVESTGYRALAKGSIFKATDGVVYKVFRVLPDDAGIRVVRWNPKLKNWVGSRNSKNFPFGLSGGRTTTTKVRRTRTSATTTAPPPAAPISLSSIEALNKQMFDNAWSKIRPGQFNNVMTNTVRDGMWLMTSTGKMGESFVKFMTRKVNRVRIYNLSPVKLRSKLVRPDGSRYNSNAAGVYWPGQKSMGIMPKKFWASPLTDTFIHEFGHHVDYRIVRRLTRGKGRSKEIKAMLMRKRRAMLKEFKAGRKAMKKEIGFTGNWTDRTFYEDPIFAIRVRDSAWNIKAPSGYSMATDREWFAEAWRNYFKSASLRVRLKRQNPATFDLIEWILTQKELFGDI